MSGTITLDAMELSEAVLGAVFDNSMTLRNIEAEYRHICARRSSMARKKPLYLYWNNIYIWRGGGLWVR